MASAFDLDAYFERIGYAGPRSATLGTLSDLHLRHTAAIPFENLSPLLKLPVKLDSESLQQKLVRDGRGGYCYEQNLLFGHALTAIGYRFTGLAARVRWTVPDGMTLGRTHMLLRIEIDDRAYIADVGFGGLTLTAPLRFEPGAEQRTPHETFRIEPTAAPTEFDMRASIGGEWRTLYTFGTEEHLLPDYEIGNWFMSTHPASRFINNLTAARPAEGRRYVLLNNEFAVHNVGGDTERRTLTSAREICDLLRDPFGIRLPDAPELETVLERFVPVVA